MASEKGAVAQSRASIETAMAADLAPVPEHGVMTHIAERTDRCVVAYSDVAGNGGKGAHHNTNSKVDMETDVCERMNQVDELASSPLYSGTALCSCDWVADRTDKDIVYVDVVGENVTEKVWFIVVSFEGAGVVVEESLNSEEAAGGYYLCRPGQDLAAKLSGANNDKVLPGNAAPASSRCPRTWLAARNFR